MYVTLDLERRLLVTLWFHPADQASRPWRWREVRATEDTRDTLRPTHSTVSPALLVSLRTVTAGEREAREPSYYSLYADTFTP